MTFKDDQDPREKRGSGKDWKLGNGAAKAWEQEVGRRVGQFKDSKVS